MTSIQTDDLQYINVILLQEVSDTSMNESSENILACFTEPHCEKNVQSQMLEETIEGVQFLRDSKPTSSSLLETTCNKEADTPPGVSTIETEQLKISPIYKITHKKDIMKIMQAKTFTPVADIEKSADSFEGTHMHVDPPNVSIDLSVQKVKDYEQISRKRCYKPQNFWLCCKNESTVHDEFILDSNLTSSDSLNDPTCNKEADTPPDLSTIETEQLEITPIYKITNKKDIMKIIQAKTFTPVADVEKTDRFEGKQMHVDPPNVSIEVSVQNVKDYEQISRKRSRKLQNFLPIPDRIVPARALAVLPSALQCRRDVITPHHRALPPKVIFGPVEDHNQQSTLKAYYYRQNVGRYQQWHTFSGFEKRVSLANWPIRQECHWLFDSVNTHSLLLKAAKKQCIKRNVSRAQASLLVNNASEKNKPIFLLKNADSTITYIDVSDKDKSNWVGLLPLGDESTANVWLQQREDKLFAVTIYSIPPQTPLKMGYCKTYAEAHNLPEGQPVLDLVAELPKTAVEWWCNECAKVMPSLLQLEIHMDKFHPYYEHKPKGRYRCRYCTRRFARLFCLKRHLLQNCKKRKSESDEKPAAEAKENDLNTAQSAEDSRLPSDESLQNFSNILDISTSLFDTDRISNLDISVSKSDDFIKLTDDIRLTNDFDWMDGLADSVKLVDDVKKLKKPRPPRSSSPISCPYCHLNMSRSKLKQHASICPWRRFECMCGIIFKCKEKLAVHVHTTHPIANVQGSGDTVKKEAEASKPKKKAEFMCEHCNMEFKRRGMYINHLSKVHNLSSSHVPLVVRDKRYPCPACPKLYQAASKRDQHVQNHHPGLVYDRKASISGGSRRIQPAACHLCPRQYATRAKLLQHTRKHHYKHYQAMQLSSSDCQISNKIKKKNDQRSLENLR